MSDIVENNKQPDQILVRKQIDSRKVPGIDSLVKLDIKDRNQARALKWISFVLAWGLIIGLAYILANWLSEFKNHLLIKSDFSYDMNKIPMLMYLSPIGAMTVTFLTLVISTLRFALRTSEVSTRENNGAPDAKELKDKFEPIFIPLKLIEGFSKMVHTFSTK